MARTNKHLPLSIAIAVVVHVGTFMLLALGYQAKQERESSQHKVINTVKAKVIDEAEFTENQRRREEALRREELKRQQQLAEQKLLEQQRLRQAEKEKRLQAKLEAEREKARLAEQKAERERKKAEEARKQAEIEKKRLAEQKKAAEAKKLAELKKRKELEQAAIDRQRLARLEQEEAEMNAEAQRLQKAREMSQLRAEYQDAIRNKIERNWRQPLDYQADDQCRVLVLQSPGGAVNDVVVEGCTGNNEFRDSVEKAVWKANPLPAPPVPELFDQKVLFIFSPRSS